MSLTFKLKQRTYFFVDFWLTKQKGDIKAVENCGILNFANIAFLRKRGSYPAESSEGLLIAVNLQAGCFWQVANEKPSPNIRGLIKNESAEKSLN